MIAASVFCPYERLLAKALDYFKTEVKLTNGEIRITFEDGFTTPTFNIGKTEVLDINLGRSEAQRIKLLSQPVWKATLYLSEGNSQTTRNITVVNDLKTDQLPFTKDSNGKHNAFNASGEMFAYPEPYYTENAKVELVAAKDAGFQPLLIRPIYQYTEPRVSGSEWSIHGPDCILFKYRKGGELYANDYSEGKSIRRSYNVLERYDDPIEIDETNREGAKKGVLPGYYISDGNVFRRFSITHAMRGIEGDFIPGEEFMKFIRCFLKLERDNFNSVVMDALDITYDSELESYILKVDVVDNRTYLNGKASAYDSKYLRRNGDIIALTDRFIAFGDGIAFRASNKDGVDAIVALTSGEVKDTAALCYVELLTRSLCGRSYQVGVWMDVFRSLFDGSAIKLDSSGKVYSVTGNLQENKKGLVINTELGSYVLDIHNTTIAADQLSVLKNGMYVARCSTSTNQQPEHSIAFEKNDKGVIVILDPRIKGYSEGADFSGALSAQKTFDEQDFSVIAFSYSLYENGKLLSKVTNGGFEYV